MNDFKTMPLEELKAAVIKYHDEMQKQVEAEDMDLVLVQNYGAAIMELKDRGYETEPVITISLKIKKITN